MPSFDTCYKLHNKCAIALVYDHKGEPRMTQGDDAHVVTTWKMAKAIVCLFGEMDADRLSGVEVAA